MRWTALVILTTLSMPTWASNPGDPFDCTDFVANEPGYACEIHFTSPTSSNDHIWLQRGANQAIDNDGRLLLVRAVSQPEPRLEIVAKSPGGAELILGYWPSSRTSTGPGPLCRDALAPMPTFQETADGNFSNGESTCEGRDSTPADRCGFLQESDTVTLPAPLIFDQINGRLLIPLDSYPSQCGHCAPPQASIPCSADSECINGCNFESSYSDGRRHWVAAINGFTTLFEIFQTYEPTTTSFSFRVPQMPEGLERADSFDTYYGLVDRPINLESAQPLRCDYPSTSPSSGDLLSFSDSTPVPPLGAAYYFVTAVTHAGNSRVGRELLGAAHSGRNAANLPSCVEAHGRERQGDTRSQ